MFNAGALNGLPLEHMEGLSAYQIQGIHKGLTRDQVNHAWFMSSHSSAAEKGIPYAEYKGLGHKATLSATSNYLAAKAKGLKYGVTAEQMAVLSAKKILAITDHGMKFEAVLGLTESALIETLRYRQIQQRSIFCKFQYPQFQAVGRPELSPAAIQALNIPAVFDNICTFLGKPKPEPRASAGDAPAP